MLRYIFIMVCILTLTGCSKEVQDDFFAMDTYMNVTISGTLEDAKAVKSEIYRLDNLLKWDRIDETDTEVSMLINESMKISEFTGGAFDITVSPFLEIWGFRDKNYRIPSQTEINDALKSTDLKYDFGGIGKGYAGRKIRELLLERGVKSGIISLGGNIQAIGSNPEGKPWKVGIQNPDGDGYICFVEVSDLAVVTSGGYHRFFEADEQKYSHIINPKTGCPAISDIKSVTVVCKDGAVADGLSTAFYVMGTDKTIKFCGDTGYKYGEYEFSAIIVDDDNNIHSIGNINVFK